MKRKSILVSEKFHRTLKNELHRRKLKNFEQLLKYYRKQTLETEDLLAKQPVIQTQP